MDIEKFRTGIQPTLEWLKAGAPRFDTPDYTGIGFNMSTTFSHNIPGDAFSDIDTTCCIGGHLLLVNGEGPYKPALRARHFLGLTEEEAYELFYIPFLSPNTSMSSITPAEAVQVLEHAAATGEIDWRIVDRLAWEEDYL